MARAPAEADPLALIQTLAVAALREHDVDVMQLAFLGASENLIFRVEQQARPPLVLRVHRGKGREVAVIQSELQWLHVLSDDPQLRVPHPAIAKVLELALPGTEGPLLASVLTWVPGVAPPAPLPPDLAWLFGKLMAQLHQRAADSVPPEKFTRPRYDAAYFQRQWSDLETRLTPDLLSPTGVATLREGTEQALAGVAQLGEEPEGLGLIHGDFHPGNFLLSQGRAGIIDFERCGFGYWWHDLAGTLAGLERLSRRAFIRGYQSFRPLPDSAVTLADLFFVLAVLENMTFLTTKTAEHQALQTTLPEVVRLVERFMTGEPILEREMFRS